MKVLLLLPVLLIPFNSAQDPAVDDSAPVSVVSARWFKDRRSADIADATGATTPAPAMIAANRNFERQRRVNDPAGVRDPNADTLDGRSAALDRIVAESRESKPPIDGFTYQAKVQNNSAKAVKTVFWEFRFKEKANPANVSRRQFVCHAKMKPAKTRDLDIFSLAAPNSVVSVTTLTKKSSNDFDETVIVNRVEFDDGSIWQRKGWEFDDVKLTAKPVSESRKSQICSGL